MEAEVGGGVVEQLRRSCPSPSCSYICCSYFVLVAWWARRADEGTRDPRSLFSTGKAKRVVRSSSGSLGLMPHAAKFRSSFGLPVIYLH